MCKKIKKIKDFIFWQYLTSAIKTLKKYPHINIRIYYLKTKDVNYSVVKFKIL